MSLAQPQKPAGGSWSPGPEPRQVHALPGGGLLCPRETRPCPQKETRDFRSRPCSIPAVAFLAVGLRTTHSTPLSFLSQRNQPQPGTQPGSRKMLSRGLTPCSHTGPPLSQAPARPGCLQVTSPAPKACGAGCGGVDSSRCNQRMSEGPAPGLQRGPARGPCLTAVKGRLRHKATQGEGVGGDVSGEGCGGRSFSPHEWPDQ